MDGHHDESTRGYVSRENHALMLCTLLLGLALRLDV